MVRGLFLMVCNHELNSTLFRSGFGYINSKLLFVKYACDIFGQ